MVSRANVAAQIMEHLCVCPEHGYSQYHREGTSGWCSVQTEVGARQVKKGDRDCSSAAGDSWAVALEGTPWEGQIPITSTHYMKDIFLKTGLFEWKPMSFIAQRGDLYLREGHHVAMCMTPNPDVLMEFSLSETGGIDGQTGDQTGWESHVRDYYDYPWDGILHYNGKADTVEPKPQPKPEPQRAYSTKLYQTNNTPMQQFKLVKHGEHYEIVSVGRPGYALDVYDGSSKINSPVRVYLRNGTKAQLFDFKQVKTKHGFICYEIVPVCAPNTRVDCVKGGTTNKTGLQIYTPNGTDAQRFLFAEDVDGKVRIISVKSGLAIDCGSGVQ